MYLNMYVCLCVSCIIAINFSIICRNNNNLHLNSLIELYMNLSIISRLAFHPN